MKRWAFGGTKAHVQYFCATCIGTALTPQFQWLRYCNTLHLNLLLHLLQTPSLLLCNPSLRITYVLGDTITVSLFKNKSNLNIELKSRVLST